MSRPQDLRKRAAGEPVHWERRDEVAGSWGYSIRGVAAPGGVKCGRTQKGPRPRRPDAESAGSNASGRASQRRNTLDPALSLPDRMSRRGRP